jgi:hypothetical protein
MVRTRDFVLFLLTVAFLLLAIVGTELWQSWRSMPVLSSWFTEVPVETDYSAEVPSEEDNRARRLAVLREKVMERLRGTEPESVVEEVVATTSESTPAAATTSPVAAVKKCSSYQALSIPWNAKTILQENREGVRVYFERGLPDTISSTTPETIRGVIPLRTWALPTSSCLPTDVIGIALDGSLIRNDEIALYTVFGPDTVVGYSLDGFPMYGPSQRATDSCGGVLVGGAYRYVLDAKRPGLITCFAAVPTRLQ